MNELMQKAKEEALLLLGDQKTLNEETYWYNIRKDVLNLIIQDNINNFLQWTPIRDTMYVSGIEYSLTEYRELRLAHDYLQWAKALNETPIGNPIYARFNDTTSENMIHHAYHLYSFEKEARKDVTSFSNVLEFGGGYGAMCRLFKNLGYKGKYIIFDLPEFNVLQRFFLKSNGYHVCDTLEEFNDVGGIYCTSKIEDLDKFYDLFIGTWSISEVPFQYRDIILNRQIDNYLIAYQEEFFGIKNEEYFKPFSNKQKINWSSWHIPHLYGNQYYMMGWK